MPIKTLITKTKIPVKIWTDEIESEAIDQLCLITELPFVFKHVAAMPDVHAGRGSTVGSVIATTDCIIPATVGADLGCGMMAVKTPFVLDQVKDILPQIRHSIERSIPVGKNWNKKHPDEVIEILSDLHYEFQDKIPYEMELDLGFYKEGVDLQFGSLGGGNHFIELCIDKENKIWLMLHSGSRNIGKKIGEYFVSAAKSICEKYHINLPHPDLAYLPIDTKTGKYYMHLLSWAQKFAFENRKEMMRRALKDVSHAITGKLECERLFEVNCHHNYVELENHFGKNVYITRKGAIRARIGDYGIIPGSMSTKSFIVEGLGNPESFNSASHGAGRKMSRTEAKRRFTIEDLRTTTEGIECRKDEGVLDEISLAYKNISSVMENQNDLVKPLYELKQLLCIKG